ncbi:hypothetical protein [Allomesorhizobium alhagi]|uniref:Uncharacterized protein n=1 Tax=Mesorhizobium alhagi CCNWXJ12-2 TaxID=1107882 RepID=H0HNJ8_9HYPH|nr:hypothetical protein [Mesorhizobium alhagi]EHK57651.1 hypothetical protein MAXJ12_08604 [Mesorhizobium alhagi CCNWXJ12-2]
MSDTKQGFYREDHPMAEAQKLLLEQAKRATHSADRKLSDAADTEAEARSIRAAADEQLRYAAQLTAAAEALNSVETPAE